MEGLRDDGTIIWIPSYPRSGNTFYRILLHSLLGVPTYAWPGRAGFIQWKGGIGEVVGQIPVPEKVRERTKGLYFIKTHLRGDAIPFAAPTVYIVRDGRDALVSFSKMAGGKNYLRFLRKYVTEVPGWSSHVLSWIHKAKTIVRYEELCASPETTLMTSLRDLEVWSGTQIEGCCVPPTFEELHAKWPSFFARGSPGAWKTEMPEDLQRIFWEVHGEAMKVAGYAD